MSLEHMFRDEQEALSFLLDEAEREGEFEMAIGYQPRNSNYHDHQCDCPGCNYDGPEPTDEEVLEMAWQDLQALPSYAERYTTEEPPYEGQETDEALDLYRESF